MSQQVLKQMAVAVTVVEAETVEAEAVEVAVVVAEVVAQDLVFALPCMSMRMAACSVCIRTCICLPFVGALFSSACCRADRRR